MAASLFRLRLFALFFLYSGLADAKVNIITSDVDIKVGNEQLLLCKAGKEADINWQKDGEDIEEDRHVVEKVDETSSKLILKNVDLTDSGTYTCHCDYETHVDDSSIKIYVYEDLNFGETKTYHEFLVNQTVHVPCVVTGKPDVEINWYRDGHLVSNDGRTFGTGYPCGSGHLTVLPNRNLQITNIRKSDHGTFTCVANIKDRSAIKKELDISVVVNVPPTVMIRSEQTNVHAGPDINVTIICLVSGNPKPTIIWTPPSTSDSSRYIYNSDKSELIIPAVARSDFGEYVCTASNKLGEDSAAFILDVSERPSVILSQEEMAVQLGKSVSVSCNATGHPSPTIEWLNHEGKKIEGSDSELNIKNLKTTDGGVYSCKANNKAGSTTKDFKLITSPAVPVYFTVSPGPTSAYIDLHAPLVDGGSPISKFVIQWRKQPQDEWSQIAIPSSDPLVVTSLAPYTEYYVRFAAKNKHFIGGLSAEKKIRTQARQGEPDRPVLSSTDGKLEGNSYSIPIKQLDDGGQPIQHFLVRYRMEKEGENWIEKEMPANSTKIQLQDLQYNSDYQMEVFAFNINGSSGPAKLNFTIPQAVSKPSLGKGGVAGIVIVVFLVLLVAVDAFCCYTNHCGLLNFLARKLFGHKMSEAKSLEEGVINNAAVDMNGLEKPRGSIPKLQAQKGETNGVHSEVTCDKAPLTKFEKPPANGDSSNEARL
ncbi:neural cell adhesion molecule 1 isoform X1 [Pygocentrus nattereri]|uniref:neural cell adhesion molecule 1 isoform X1 n=1 Tax=Pygocentrus nattereri TaxID=42514 RepID=UPI0008149456|nr:neural cell adhesion molecule 1 isoform X1 [Pygocentrus nattereri]